MREALAVQAFEEGLRVVNLIDHPVEYAMLQNNLGNALQTLGERGNDQALHDAVSAYRAALEVYSRDSAPTDWAAMQNNLGTVLHKLGERGDDQSLRDAVSAYRAALEVRTRASAPADACGVEGVARAGHRGADRHITFKQATFAAAQTLASVFVLHADGRCTRWCWLGWARSRDI